MLIVHFSKSKEVWKDIPITNGSHEVSSLGRVRSKNGFCKGGRGCIRQVKGKTLKPWKLKKTGYLQVDLGKGCRKLVHRLVLEAFVGPCPEGMECCHNDGDRTNNKLTNLRWDTPRNNQLDRKHQGTWIEGERHHNAKLTEEQVKEIRKLYNAGKHTQMKLASMFSIHQTVISDVVNYVYWKHIE